MSIVAAENKLSLSGSDAQFILQAGLPEHIESLEIRDCASLTYLPRPLPPRLRFLHVVGCDNLLELPSSLPQSLESIKASSCKNLRALPELPQSLASLDVNNCPELQSLPSQMPPLLNILQIAQCCKIRALPPNLPESLKHLFIGFLLELPSLNAQPSSLKIEIDGTSNPKLIRLSEQCQASIIVHWAVLPQFLPDEILDALTVGRLFRSDANGGMKKIDLPVLNLDYVNHLLIARVSWQKAIADTTAGYRRRKPPETRNDAEVLWLGSLANLHLHRNAWGQPPNAELQAIFLSNFVIALEHHAAMSVQELVRVAGDVTAAICVLHGSALSGAEITSLSYGIMDIDARAVLTGKTDPGLVAARRLGIVVGLKVSAYIDAFRFLHGLERHPFADCAAALALVLTFGKSWRSWLECRAQVTRQNPEDAHFVHDAVYWLPARPASSLIGLADWLFDVHHRGKPINMLDIVASNWPDLTAAERALPYEKLLDAIAGRAYPAVRNDRFALEAASWGIEVKKYEVLEYRFIESLSVPLKLPVENRWREANANSRLTGRFLPREDVRGVFLGYHTNCCQHPNGTGSGAAWAGQEESECGFFVVENADGRIVAQSFAWISADGGLCFDSLESKGIKGRETRIASVYQCAAIDLLSLFHTVTIGKGIGAFRPEEYWPKAGRNTLTGPAVLDSEASADSAEQFLLAKR
jgi:hypothetical protein